MSSEALAAYEAAGPVGDIFILIFLAFVVGVLFGRLLLPKIGGISELEQHTSEDGPTIGFIGQGFIGKSYADDFENRGYSVVRYALEEPYRNNGELLKNCDIVFIAVPTPTTPTGFNDSILRDAIKHAPDGSIVVIKSTVLPGTTESIQEQYPDKIILHSPEFLTATTAAYDAAHPFRNIIGIPVDSAEHRQAAERVLEILPRASYENICTAREAEYIKYGGNNWFYFKVIFINLLYDLTQKDGCNWNVIRDAMAADPRIGSTHLNPVHSSGDKGGDVHSLKFNELHLEPVHKSGRGAGGFCFIKDFAAFTKLYEQTFPEDKEGVLALKAVEKKNIKLLKETGKDLDLLAGVYGENPDVRM